VGTPLPEVGVSTEGQARRHPSLQHAQNTDVTGRAAASASACTQPCPDSGDHLARFVSALSPRRKVRLATASTAGGWVNDYSDDYPVAELHTLDPAQPVAMHLAPWQDHARSGFRYVVGDCDAKAVDAAQAAADAELLRDVAELCGISPVTACSGPSAGRHVWMACQELVPPELAARIAAAARRCCPTLDPSPMTNARTGCVRPPGSPHRDGGHVHLLDHTIEEAVATLTLGSPLSCFYELADFLEARAQALIPAPRPPADEAAPEPAAAAPRAQPSRSALPPSIAEKGEPVRAIEPDATGHPKLRTPKRAPSERTREALARALTADDDHSAHAFAVLLGLVLAGWTYADAARLVRDPRSSPGLEWFRTTRTTRAAGALRTVHSSAERDRRLTRQWHLAVHAAARLPRTRLDDDDAPEVTAAVRSLLSRMQTAGSNSDRWTRPSGPADRAVLIAVAHQALIAVTLILALDVRRLGLLAGYSQQTANEALKRLFLDGWLTEVAPGDQAARRARTLAINEDTAHCCTGHRGHVCAVPDHSEVDVSQGHSGSDTSVNARPPHQPRENLIAELSSMLDTLSADVWSAPGVGHHVAWTLLALSHEPTTVENLMAVTRYTERTTRRHLSVLETFQLAERAADPLIGWRRTELSVHQAGRVTRAQGRGVERAAKYRIDRAVAEWWQAELEWLRADRVAKRRRGRRASADQLVLPGSSGTTRAYPRTVDGEPDHARAWTIEALRLGFGASVLAGLEATAAGEPVDLEQILRTGTLGNRRQVAAERDAA
jgi:hypothetical protein